MIRAPGTGRLTASISSPTAASQPSSSASRTRLSAEYQLLAWEARRVGMVSAKLGVLFSRVCIYVAGGWLGGEVEWMAGCGGGGCRGWLHGGVVTRAGAPGRVTEGCIIAHLRTRGSLCVFWRQATSSSIMHVHNNNSKARRPIDKTSTSKRGFFLFIGILFLLMVGWWWG